MEMRVRLTNLESIGLVPREAGFDIGTGSTATSMEVFATAALLGASGSSLAAERRPLEVAGNRQISRRRQL